MTTSRPRPMPPEIKQALDRLGELIRDPDSTDTQVSAARDDVGRVAREVDPEFAAYWAKMTAELARVTDEVEDSDGTIRQYNRHTDTLVAVVTIGAEQAGDEDDGPDAA